MRPTLALSSLATLFAVVIGVGLFTAPRPAVPAPPAERRVKLAVLVVFDQMRGDYLERWRPLFGPDGFARLQRDGAWFTHCHYPYGVTTTGPGHASMLTGACGDAHGIVSNDWIEDGRGAYCAGDERYKLVPPAPTFPPEPGEKPPAKPTPKPVGTPERLKSETVADILKEVHGANSKVFGLSLKDRSAILPTGKRPDGAYWFYGTFGTSTYYTEKVNDTGRIHPWVEQFNASKFANQWSNKDWTYLRPDLDYTRWSGQSDNTRGEGTGAGVSAGPLKGWNQKIAFPHPMNPTPGTPGRTYYEALANSPFGNDLLLEFTKTCVTAENLGVDDVPDLLVVSFSSNDLIGHTWGPDSHEVLDVTLRSDALMAELLNFLDTNVGKDRYLLGITADHGVCPLPEVTFGPNPPRGRVSTTKLQEELDKHLTDKFPTPKPAGAKFARWTNISFPWVHLKSELVTASGRPRAEIATAAAEFLAKYKDDTGNTLVMRTFTQAELSGTFPEADVIANRMKRSFYPSRCGDVAVVLQPYSLPGGGTGTTHGAPFNYDTHVPLVVYGPGISGGMRTEPTTPQAMASIFAKWLNVRRPKDAAFPVPKSLE